MTSPDRGRYRNGAAIFAIDRSGPAIAEAGRATILNDCLEVSAATPSRRGRDGRHRAEPGDPKERVGQLAAGLPASPSELGLLREPAREQGSTDVIVAGPYEELGEEASLASGEDKAVLDEAAAPSAGRPGPSTDLARAHPAGPRLPAVIGVGVPLAWFVAVGPEQARSRRADDEVRRRGNSASSVSTSRWRWSSGSVSAEHAPPAVNEPANAGALDARRGEMGSRTPGHTTSSRRS